MQKDSVKTKKEANPFFTERTKTSKKVSIALREILELFLGHRPTYFSKRLAPAMAFCNGRIYCKEGRKNPVMVWDGDLDFYEKYQALGRIAEKYEVILLVFSESGQSPVWTSQSPDEYLGWVPDELKEEYVGIRNVYPYFKSQADETRQQWLKDHGLLKTKRKAKREKNRSTDKKSA